MNVILDSHVLIWALTDDARLPVVINRVMTSNPAACYALSLFTNSQSS